MAKREPGLLGKISGSIGNTQFYHTPKGEIISMKSKPTYIMSPARERSTGYMARAAKAWAHVDPFQADLWNRFVVGMTNKDKFNDDIPYTNREIFISVNINRLEINESIILAPPPKVYPKPFLSPEVEIETIDDSADIRLFFKHPFPKNTKVIIYASKLLKPGVNKVKDDEYRMITVIDSTFISGSSIFAEYKEVHYKYVEGKYQGRIKFKFRPVSVVSGLGLPPSYYFASNLDNFTY